METINIIIVVVILYIVLFISSLGADFMFKLAEIPEIPYEHNISHQIFPWYYKGGT